MEIHKSNLIDIGIETEEAIERLGGNESLYHSLCDKFAQDKNFHFLQEALSVKDYKSAEFYIHTLKGVAANLGFVRLEIISGSILQDLRENNFTNLKPDNICLTAEYNRIITLISA